MVRPNTGEAVGLQLDLDLQMVGRRLALHGLLLLLHPRQDAEQVLHVMADLVGDHISLGEFAGLAAGIAALEARLDLLEERGIEIDLLVDRAIERPHGASRRAAARVGRAAVHDQRRRPIGLAVLGEDVLPLDLGAAQYARHEAAHLVLGHAGLPLARGRLHLRLIAAAGEQFGAPDQNPRIDAERPADQPQHHDGADAQAAASARQAAEAAAAFLATILDVAAFRKVIQTHGSISWILARAPFDIGARQSLPSAKYGSVKPIFTLGRHDALGRL